MADEQMPIQASGVLEAAPEELEQTFAGPALYANKIYGTISNFGLRLAFMEGRSDGREYFRTAVYLDTPDAESLKNLLNGVLEKVERPAEPQGNA